jgi:hypothetical protein
VRFLPHRMEQPAPANPRDERQRQHAILVPAVGNEQWRAMDAIAMQRAPAAGVVRFLPVVAHHEERIPRRHERTPVQREPTAASTPRATHAPWGTGRPASWPAPVKDKNFLFLRCGEFLLRTKNLPSYLCGEYIAGCTALSITTKSHKDRRSKSVSVQEIPPRRLKDDRLPLLVITNNQEYPPLSGTGK